jgi:glycosyltransferase involved in cell wall biosynthesis
MDLSVVLCTYNRCAGLAETLTSLAGQRVRPETAWEVLVVDNNSSDRTAEVCRDFRDSFPAPLRYVFEARQGLSHARNRGIAEAAGHCVAFAEDDELADQGWVQSLIDAFREHGCDAVAGRIELEWRSARPAWVTDELLAFLGRLDYGEVQKLTRDRPPFGGNMAFRKQVFDAVGAFDTRLGRQGRKLVGGEEIDLYERFVRAGMTAFYEPKAVVHHVVDKNRLSKSYFRRLHFNEGRVRGTRQEIQGGRRVLGVPLFLLPQLYRSFKSFVSAGLRRGFGQSLREEMTVWYFIGFILGARSHTYPARCI